MVSDCDAVKNLYTTHKFKPTQEGCAAAALNAGVDVDCGPYYTQHLPSALTQGLVQNKTVTQAMVRLLYSQLKLGLYDPPSQGTYLCNLDPLNICSALLGLQHGRCRHLGSPITCFDRC